MVSTSTSTFVLCPIKGIGQIPTVTYLDFNIVDKWSIVMIVTTMENVEVMNRNPLLSFFTQETGGNQQWMNGDIQGH